MRRLQKSSTEKFLDLETHNVERFAIGKLNDLLPRGDIRTAFAASAIQTVTSRAGRLKDSPPFVLPLGVCFCPDLGSARNCPGAGRESTGLICTISLTMAGGIGDDHTRQSTGAPIDSVGGSSRISTVPPA